MQNAQGITYLHGDHLGSTSVTSGATSSTQVYYPFGAVRASSGTLPTDFTFTGQKFDASDGLMYYGARYYDAALGRFISADTIVPGASNPQNLNRYAYVRNNPLKYIDPTGHAEVCDDWGSGCGQEGTGDPDPGGIACGSSAAKCNGFDPSEGYHQFTLTELYANHGIYVNANGELVSRGGLTGLSQNFFNKIAGYWNGEYGTTENGDPYVPGPFEQVGLGAATGKLGQQVQAALTEAGPMAFAIGVGFAKEWEGTSGVAVIGKLGDLRKPGALNPGERTLDWPDQGSPKLNWDQNSGRLREAMGEGYPIRDLSPDKSGGFLAAERELLGYHNWQFDPATSYWYPPGW